MQKLSHSVSGALRTFSFWVANGTLGLPVLDGRPALLEEPSALEQTYAIFADVLVLDDDGNVVNAKRAERRAAQFVRSYCDSSHTVDPPFEGWEVELHDPPPRTDPI
jgi:hypothetical protein